MTSRRPRIRRSISIGNRTGSSDHVDSGAGEDIEDLPITTDEGEEDDTDAETGSDGLPLPQVRLAAVESTAPEYSREYRLGMVHQLLLRKVSLDQIAQQFGVAVRTIQNDRAEIFRRMREEASNLDINELIGRTMAFYDDIIGSALRISTATKNPIPSRLAAMRTAMQGKKETAQWLSAAGVFDVLKFKAAEDNGNIELSRLVELTEQVLGDEEFDINDDGEDVMSGIMTDELEEVRLL